MARRQTTTFSMSFLDVISCGFGAVVLFYTIISAQAGLYRIKENSDLNAESQRLEQEVLDGYKHLAELQERARLDRGPQDPRGRPVERDAGEAEGDRGRARRATRTTRSRGARALERLKADLKSLEESTRRLKEARAADSAVRAAPVVDDQQLVTLRVDGRRVLVLVDASASMLDETVVNIIRLRNMPPERRIASAKWQQAVNTDRVGGLAPAADSTQFQVYAFDTAPRPLVEGSAGRWLERRRRRPDRGGAAGAAQDRADRRLEPAERLRRHQVARPGAGQRDPGDGRPADPGRQAAAHAHAGDHGAARGPHAGRGEVAAAVAAALQHRAAADGGRPRRADLLLAPRARRPAARFLSPAKDWP